MFSRLAVLFAAGVLAIAGLATGTAHAAVTQTVLPPKVECGKVTLTVPAEEAPPANADKVGEAAKFARFGNLYLRYEVDGRERMPLRVEPSQGTVKTIGFDEDSGIHWVRYRLSGANAWSDRIRVESDCRPNYERAETPTVVQPECDATLGKLVIPSDRGVTYRVSRDGERSRVVRAGEYNVRPGVYWVRAYAQPGHRLVGERSWRLVIEAAEACPTPTPTPTVTVTPTVDPTPDPEPTPTVTETETEEPTPAPTVTQTSTRVIVVNEVRVPDRVDTGFGGLATK